MSHDFLSWNLPVSFILPESFLEIPSSSFLLMNGIHYECKHEYVLKLGAIILDTCSSDSYALNQSLEFIRASINTVEGSAFQCSDGSIPRPKYGMKIISGVVGGSYSEVSLQVANLLRLFKIPQVSYASTGTSLSDKTRYDFFARTVPPDTFQALALVDVVQSFNWSYVSIVSSEGQYGDSGMKAFIHEARARNMCIAVNEKVPHSASSEHFDMIFAHLLTKPNAKAVVLFVRMEDARGILKAAQRANNINFFTWVASDGWGKEEKLVEGVEEVAEGAITVELQTTIIKEFDTYMKSLNPSNNKRNPWFNEVSFLFVSNHFSGVARKVLSLLSFLIPFPP